MREGNIQPFSGTEQEFIDLLSACGFRSTIAKVLVFLNKTPGSTSRAIERGADLRQPEVSLATRYLIKKNWVASRESGAPGKGRPEKIYALAQPLVSIIDGIEEEKKRETDQSLRKVEKVREFAISFR